ALCITSRPLFAGCTRLMSEAPFVAFTLASLWFVARRRFVLAAIFIAAATLTRYAGISLLPVALYVLLFSGNRTRRQRLIDLAIVVAIIAVAMEAWAIHNHAASHPFGGRTFTFHPPAWSKIYDGAGALGTWL